METSDTSGYVTLLLLTYKCRFCPCVCSTAQELIKHVKDTHLKAGTRAEDLVSPEGEPKPGKATKAQLTVTEETEGRCR